MFLRLGLLIYASFPLLMSSADGKNAKEAIGHFKDEVQQESVAQNALALVPYEQNDHPLGRFHQENWEFNFSGRRISIHQNWNHLGVAGVVWDAAVVLCEYLEKNQDLVKDKRVVELGAGTGLVGIVAGLLGADITITDREDVLKHLNNVVASNIPVEVSHKVRVEELDWTENLQRYAQPFDVVLGADVIYIKETFSHLLKTLLHLSDSDSLVLLSCRIRYDRDTDFLTLLEEKFTVTLIFKEKERDIHIYSAKKKS